MYHFFKHIFATDYSTINFIQGIQELLLNNRGQEKLQILIESFQSDTFMQVLRSNSNTCPSLFVLARQCGLTQVFSPNTDVITKVGIAGTCDPTTESSTASNSETANVISTTGKKTITSSSSTVKSRASNITMDLSSLSSAHLLAVLCMLSYAHKHNGKSGEGINVIRAFEEGVESGKSFSDHMLKFDAGNDFIFIFTKQSFYGICVILFRSGVRETMLSLICGLDSLTCLITFIGTQLAYACSDAATAAEKEPHRQYTFAILIFELLLALPYLPHRRGYWYKRLCIDYSHLQLHRCALRACHRCLVDNCVNVSLSLNFTWINALFLFIDFYVFFVVYQVSDKTDLASRATALKQKILKQHVAATSTTNKKPNNRNNDCVDVKNEINDTAGVKMEDNWSLFAVERDFSTVLTSTALQTEDNLTSTVGDTEVNQDMTEKSGRKSRSKRTNIQNNPTTTTTTTTTNTIASDLTGETAEGDADLKGSALPVLCLINILPAAISISNPTVHSVLDVLYNTLLREIVCSPHATSAANTEPLQTNASTVDTTAAVKTSADSPSRSGFALTIQDHSASETGKRKLINTTTTLSSSSKLSKSHTVSGATSSANHNSTVSWACTVCTFVNITERFCSMCMTARVTTALRAISNNGAQNSKPIRSSTTNSISAFTKANSTVNKVNSSSGISSSSVVDLVSDDDEDEVEIIDIITPTKVYPAKGIPPTQNMISVQSTSNSTTMMNAVTNKSPAEATVVTSPSVVPNGDVGSAELATFQTHLHTSYTTMLQYLQSLVMFRHTICKMAHTSTETNAQSNGLNIKEGNGEGEEEDDLILLGLLPDNTQCKAEHTIAIKEEKIPMVNASSNSRPSLEDLIPAPPFFVVTGKRTGDPANRKGKSKFCGKQKSCSATFIVHFRLFYSLMFL